jgi:hypothetical protein
MVGGGTVVVTCTGGTEPVVTGAAGTGSKSAVVGTRGSAVVTGTAVVVERLTALVAAVR